jgi:hypothetical protein
MAVLAAAALVVGLAACGDDSSSEPAASTPTTLPAQLTGLPIGQARLAADQQARATQVADSYSKQLVDANPELAGISAATITPVYDEHSTAPIGAMARWTLPARVREIQLDLVRLHRSTGPEAMPSQITNLRALEMIFLFDRDQIVYVGIAPGPDDAADPDDAAVVHPLDPEQHRSPDFGGAE